MSPTSEQQIIGHLLELKDQVGELKGKVDEAIMKRMDASDGRLNDHTRRIRLLEHYAWIITGIVLLLGFFIYNVSTVHTMAETLEKHRAATEQQGKSEVLRAEPAAR